MGFYTVLQIFPHPSVCQLWAQWAEGLGLCHFCSLALNTKHAKWHGCPGAAWIHSVDGWEGAREKRGNNAGRGLFPRWKKLHQLHDSKRRSRSKHSPRVLVSVLVYFTELSSNISIIGHFVLANSALNNTLHHLIFFTITVRTTEYFIQLMHCSLCHWLHCPCCWTLRLFSTSAVIEDVTVKSSTLLVNYLT